MLSGVSAVLGNQLSPSVVWLSTGQVQCQLQLQAVTVSILSQSAIRFLCPGNNAVVVLPVLAGVLALFPAESGYREL